MIPEVVVMSYPLGDTYSLLIPDRPGDTFLGWYKDFRLTQEFDVAATIRAFTVSDIDTYGTLMDNGENIIFENDDSPAGGYNFLIEYELEPGTYIIAVEAYDSAVTGDYTFVLIKN
jgi:hypothetical protein